MSLYIFGPCVCRHYGLQPYMCKLCDKTFSEPSAAHKHVKATHKKADRSLVMVNNPDWSQLQVIVPDNFFKTVLFGTVTV
jgi:hypothetical protein